MFGINGNEFLVIILVAVIVVGPQRLPEYTRKLTQLVRQLRVFLDNARSQIAEEVGPEMADLDLSSLDPRQYDPRKIVRDALGEDIDAIREDLAHPFRSVGSAAKEMSDDAAQAVNDVVKKDRASSLSKQIEAKRDERLAEKDTEKAENTESTEGAENAEGPQSAEQPPATAPRGVLQQADDVEHAVDAEAETDAGSVESAEGAEPEKTEPEQSGEAEVAEDAESTEQPEQSDRPAEPVEVPTSLVEPQAAAAGEDAGDATAAGDDSRNRVHPLSPRDIVRAANAAARTRAEAARIAVDF
ncbi:twin-arginine translocase TatA/TatE family subunit [Actinomyces sp. oral taxon 169]|uniref:twin-arginine translocase TatA/TatE family subunit n=1 Tax=Actinomyces sp. oral taxon 169 TaxID=712116 RepID=UPI0015FE836F|nr:twin-arginine translocase TatA/TatE family subunit [Actinomyces sp. oral taxon 169]QLF52992.1 twin-arginine translocase TatA/TatE family subunit [Actinomyces sp. oral taxon 169]